VAMKVKSMAEIPHRASARCSIKTGSTPAIVLPVGRGS
jgi:hypothetical protein